MMALLVGASSAPADLAEGQGRELIRSNSEHLNSDQPYFSADGDTLYIGEYSVLRCDPPIAPVADAAPRIRGLICDWGEEVRLTHYVDSAGNADYRALCSSGDTIILGYGANFGTSRPYRYEILLSQDFGIAWSGPQNYETPGTLRSSILDFTLSNDTLFMAGSASRDAPNTSTPYFRKRGGFDGPWTAPFFLLNRETYLFKWPRLVAVGDTVHYAFYQAYRAGEYVVIDSLYYFRSTSLGATWERGVPLTHCPGAANAPICLTSCSGYLNIIFEDGVGQGPSYSLEIFQLLSTDGGDSWERRALTIYDSIPSQLPAVFSDNENRIILTWYDYKYGSGPSGFTGDILARVSNDGGLSWGPEARVTSQPTADYSAPFVSGDLMGVAWEDHRFGLFQSELYYAESVDAGSTWSENIRLTDAPNFSFRLEFVVDGRRANLFWEDSRDGRNFQYEIYMRSYDVETAIRQDSQLYPITPQLIIYPNPFNNMTIIAAGPDIREIKSLEIFDVMGRKIRILLNECESAKGNNIIWDGTNDDGKPISSGVYLLKALTSEGGMTCKVTIIK